MTIGSWGRWGADDEVGALNLVTDAVTRDAVALVRRGRTLSLAQPLGPQTPQTPHRRPPARWMDRDAGDYALGARAPGEFKFAEDTVQFPVHSGTHVDALAHAWSGDELYNGHGAAATRTTSGARRCGADKLRPVLTRGVLVDVVHTRGRALAASEAVGVDDLRAGVAEAGVDIGTGDAVLVRTGWAEARGGETGYFSHEPGLDEAAARWLAGRDVALVGADNYAVERQGTDAGFPVHLILLHQHGVPLLENLQLAELATALAAERRSTFLFAFAPLPLVGSTGSPVNPLAVL